MTLEIFWFCVIAVFWGGYFVLEGFDFGVGMLLPVVPRNEEERGALFDTIGPVWDGNEVWLVVAGAATFAAFPTWYGAMFSGFYLALLLILVLLIVRVVSFEWRGKSDDPRWRAAWLGANAAGSIGAPFLWGVALANLLQGVPLNSDGDYAGSLVDLFSPYSVFFGLAIVLLFAFHGSAFLVLRTVGELCRAVARVARLLSIPSAVAVGGLVIWTVAVAVDNNDKGAFPPVLPAALTIATLALAVAFVFAGRSGGAFSATAIGTLLTVATLFTSLYPRVMVSQPSFDNSLTISNASSSHYALVVITIVALIITPVVLLYQGWTYYVLRARITGREAAPAGRSLTPGSGETPAA